MKKIIKVTVILSFTILFSICISCFKTKLQKVRIFDIELESYNQNFNYLTEGDTCNCEDWEIRVYLRDEYVAGLLMPSLIGEAYAFSFASYFDFTNKIKDFNIYIQDTKNDSIEISNDCRFSFDNNEISDKEQLIESCNNRMDYYKDNVAESPWIYFSFNINNCHVDSIEFRRVIVYLEMSDELIRGTTEFIYIKDKN